MSAGPRIVSFEPTLFLTREQVPALRRLCRLSLENPGAETDAMLSVGFGGSEQRLKLGRVPGDVSSHDILLPDWREPGSVVLGLVIDGTRREERSFPWQPCRHWECHVVHGSHHDIGYTDLPSNVLREHAVGLDQVIEFCEETESWPEGSRFAYVVEQAWSALYHLENRPASVVERMVSLMRSGRVELTALFANETSELCGHEEQIRLLYPAFRLARRHGIRIVTAELNDIPGVAWGLVSVLAGAGIRYFAPGLPDYFGWGLKVRPLWDEQAVLPRDMLGAFRWEGPDRSRVLFWYGGAGISSLDLWSTEQAERDFPAYLSSLELRGYPHEVVRLKVHGGHRDNSPPDMRFSRIAREWNERWAYPRLLVSTNARFFARFDETAGESLRVLRGDLPNTDYPIGATSRARELGVNRNTHEVLASAEKLAAWAAVEGGLPYPAEALAEANEAVLIGDEHTGGMSHPVGPAHEASWSWKAERVWRGAALAHDVLVKSSNRIADQVGLEREGFHVLVFNTLAQARTDLVRLGAFPPEPAGSPMYWREPAGSAPATLVLGRAAGRALETLPAELLERPFELLDTATGASVPFQVTSLGDPLAARPWASELWSLGNTDQHSLEALNFGRAHLYELVFVAEEVPGMGYRTYRIAPRDSWATRPTWFSRAPGVLESRYYRVELDVEGGGLSSILDKESGREWVDRGPSNRVNQLLSRSPRSSAVEAARCAELLGGESGPVLESLVSRGSAPGCPQVTQEITLYAGLKRIDFATRLLRDATPLLEHYVAFPFSLRSPRFRYETANAAVEPVRDQLPGTNTDAVAVQHWVSVADDGGWLTWTSRDAPVVEMGGLRPSPVSQAHHAVTPPGFGGSRLRDPALEQSGHLHSFVMDNNFRTNFQASQVGDMLFRYSLTTGAGASEIGRDSSFGWSVATPLEPVCVRGPRTGRLDPVGRFCVVEPDGVVLLALKSAEDGEGLVVRLWESRGLSVEAVLTLGLEIRGAQLSTLTEDQGRELEHGGHRVRVHLEPFGHATVRIRCGMRSASPVRFTYLA